MNIAFLTPEYPHPQTGASGGIGTSIKNLAQSLVLAGHAVFVYVYGQPTDDTILDGAVRVTRIKNRIRKGISWWLTRKKIEQVINADIPTFNIEMLEVPDWTGISAWTSFNCPVVMRLHGSDTFFCSIENRKVKWWNRLQEQTAYASADGIIAVSDYVGAGTNTVFGTSKTYTVIPNGIETSLFNPSPVEPAEQSILYFGTLIRKKGVLELPDIFNRIHHQLPTVKLILIGADASDIQTGSRSTWELMQEQFSERALNLVSYLGKVPYDSIQTYIEQAAVCVFPSYAEACPVSWIEAMSMEKAIVASDIGWASEIIRHTIDGILVHPADHTTFAASIVELLNNRDMRRTLGQNARMRCLSEFDSGIIASQSVTYYQHIIDGI